MMEIEIKKLSLRDLHWGIVEDWSRLCPSKIGVMATEYITKEDIFRFYDLVVREIARQVGQPYEDVKTIIDDENTPFIEYVEQIFKKKKMYERETAQIRKLRLILLVPQADATLKSMLRLYWYLTDEQKREFKNAIGAE